MDFILILPPSMKTETLQEQNEDDFRNQTESLINFKKDLKGLVPGITLIKNEASSQKLPHQVQDVILSRQWSEFSKVQNQIFSLKKKLQFETDVYENLKQICFSLTLDEENLHILKNGSFQKDEDLMKMEKSLKLITEFSESKYDINIILDSKKEVSGVIIQFLQRFIVFLSKAFGEPDSKSELKVHTAFYNSIKKFKFIYKASKTNSEYYNVLCKAYIKKSMELYNKEFHSHLNRLSELINDNKSLEIAIETVFKSYICLLESETDFMKLMEIESNSEEIFLDVNVMIISFIDLFYKQTSYCVLATISQFLDDENISKLGLLGTELKKKGQLLNEVFLHQHKSSALSFELIDLINFLKRRKLNIELCDKLTSLVFEKAISSMMNKELGEGIKNLQIMHCLEDKDNLPKILDVMKQRIAKKIIDSVFGSEEMKSGISNVFSYLKKDKNGLGETKSFLREIILENCDDTNRNEVIRILAKF